jgi:allophanate hydrolase subunit 1|tara:strand:- start:316 stop:609 length:294 start_codon:yes stop_codon:yes gene_type:complete
MAKNKKKEVKVQTQKAEKIHEKHLKKLQDLVNAINAIQFNIGKMEVQKQTAIDELKRVQQGVGEMQDLLVREYGTYDVNVHDGTINWAKPNEEKNEG